MLNLSPQSPDLGPLSSICPMYMAPLAALDLAAARRIRGRKMPPTVVEDGGRRPLSLRPESCVGGGRLRGRTSHTCGPPCLQAPNIHATIEEDHAAAVEEEDPRRRRSRRKTRVPERHARHQRPISTRRSLPSMTPSRPR
jgi:hypothetical protein